MNAAPNTLTVVRWSAHAPASRDALVRRFVEFAPAWHDDAPAVRAPSVAYADAVVSVALRRPAELLLALDGDGVVGRAMIAESFAEPGACGIGLYAVAPGSEAHATGAALIGAARAWAASRGYTTLYAPIDVNTWFAYRFALPTATTVPESRHYSWEPSHPAEYVSHFRALGFDDAERYRSDFVSLPGFGADDVARHTAGSVARAVAAGFSFAPLDERGLDALDELHPLCLEAFRSNRLFEPVTLGVFRALIAASTRDRDVSHSHIVRDAGGHLAGFILALRESDTLIVKTLAVSPAARRHGLATALTHLAVNGAAHQGVRTLAMALIHTGNASEAFARQYMLPGSTAWVHEYVLLQAQVRAMGVR